MTCHTKEELENMLCDVVNELDLSDAMLDKHGPDGTAPAILVREVLAQKDLHISMLRRGFVEISPNAGLDALRERERAASIALRIKDEEHNCCAQDLIALRAAANALLHQIDIGDFVDSNGHSAKMLKAVHDLMRVLRVKFYQDEG